MTRALDIRSQLVGAWCVPVAMVLFGLSLINLSHFIPPLSPTMSPQEVAAFYHTHSVGIRLGMILFLFSGTLLAPVTAIFCICISRIEAPSRFLTYTQLITGTVALMLFVPPALFWTAAAFRPERAVEQIVLLNDLGWLFFVMITPPGILQVILIGVAALRDKRAKPLFPRWLGYFNLWAAILFLPGGFVSLFMTGPFAWNGVIAFWIPVAVFGVWWWIMFFMCLKAIRRPDTE